MDIQIPLHLPSEAGEQLKAAKGNATRSDTNFLNKLIDGYKWQVYALSAIQSYGHWGAVHPLRIRPTASERSEYGDEYDILIGPKASRDNGVCSGWVKEVDVKARTRTFTTPDSFPFDTIIIEPSARLARRGQSVPDYWCMVSQFNGALIFINYEDTAMHWSQESKKGIRYTTAPRECFLTLGQFLEELPD
jgi:hypothetical protein